MGRLLIQQSSSYHLPHYPHLGWSWIFLSTLMAISVALVNLAIVTVGWVPRRKGDAILLSQTAYTPSSTSPDSTIILSLSIHTNTRLSGILA